MLILALDTTTKRGSMALWRDGLVEERAGDASRSHAERLPGDLVALLADHGTRLGDIERYAVASGPGSFTGLRVGIAAVQGLALVHDRQVVPVSALELLAQQGAREARLESGRYVGAWMEAYRREVFGALYRVATAAADASALADLDLVLEPRVASPVALASEWHAIVGDGGIVVAGDAVASTRDVLREAFGDRLEALAPAALAGTLAAIAARDGQRAVRPHAIVPLYVRRPDAELARDRAEAASLATLSQPRP